jgi:hypothetical protein
MPVGVVKTPEDETKWNRAKQIAESQGHKEDWAYINGIFQKMKGKGSEKTASLRPLALVLSRAARP